MNTEKLIEDVRRTTEDYHATTNRLQAARTKAIRRARSAGVPVGQVAEAAGVTEGRVSQITRADRDSEARS